MTMQTRSGFVLFLTVMAACGSAAMADSVRLAAKAPARDVREFDPDAGTEAPDALQIPEGEAAGVAEGCEAIGAFTPPGFQFAARYRGNLYSITDSGVSLKEIQMELAFTGTADFFVSVHRKMPDNSYVEVDINPTSPTQGFAFIADATGLGANVPAFYSTGNLNGAQGIELPPGQYAIGFAWGPESVRYARDSGVSYPRAIDVGFTVGSVSRELGAGEPPVPATIPSLSFFSGGAYSQVLCFVPVEGACCLSDGANSRCENLLETACIGEGSFFHGQRTTCKDTICEFGACCFECATNISGFPAKCGDNYTEDSCLSAGGRTFLTELSCPAEHSTLCPKITGACCNTTTGACEVTCEAQCVAPRVFRGEDTDCDEFTHLCKGACCISGGCQNRVPGACTSPNQFRGDGTRCELLDSDEECGGACCRGFTSLEFCEVVEHRALCAYTPDGFPETFYRGDGTTCSTCSTTGIVVGGCCLPEGQCINTHQNFCTATWVKGTWLGPTQRCENAGYAACQGMPRRCCTDDGTCLVLTNQGNTADPRGACTIRDGTPISNQSNCDDPNACVAGFAGACCGTAVAACTMATPQQCTTQGGTYQGDSTDCTNAAATCPGFGACCRGNDDCFDHQTPAECSNVGGAYGGAGTTCSSPQVDCETRGACCAVTGTCLSITAGNCAERQGEFKGVGVQCAPGVCLSGACCLPDDECKKRTPLACQAQGGDYIANNIACGPQTCELGACCRNNVCGIESPAECAVNAGVYAGKDTQCITDACATGSCCRISGSCVPNVVRSGCAAPGEVFHLGMACAPGMCTAVGACCTGITCSLTTQQGCTGVFRGIGIPCDDETCAPTGACCNNTTCATKTQAACISGSGQYKGNGVVCDDTTCPPQPTGACCNGQACLITTQAGCGAQYLGNGTTCSPNPCLSGQCAGFTSSDPATCWVDARRPHAQNNPGTLQGRNSLTMTFGSACAAAASDFTVTCSPTAAPCPSVTTVTAAGATQTITLSSVIPAGNWTCVKHTATNAQVCMGNLPGDVDGNRATAPADILKLIDNLNGIVNPALLPDHCDMDRSAVCAAADIITLIDLLNGNGFAVWNGKNLPVCPGP